ncbi:hypothetical protein K2173_009874 [Erythroxylum novogranatense]|uniref:NAD(P)H-quinone oxidoreductase subunit 6, chloroplastic n=1 Tax=Erythroxylum novogranatense TaxID=1862640 RepID=A0AAV8T0L2_9ROSI|nr:hypothetical protein K2173_009874 [Erythroxylum novogranatense]
MCLELILNAVNINLLTFSDFFYNCRPIHDFLLILLGIDLILGGLGVVFFTNPIYSAFSLGLVFVCISLFYILSNYHFVAVAQLLIYVGAINVLILFVVMFMNGS